MQQNSNQDPLTTARKPNRLTRLSVSAGAGLLATLLAAGLGGVASAQTVVGDAATPTEAAGQPVVRVTQSGAIQFDDDSEDSELFESSPEDEAVWERFEQCLTDAGLDVESESHAAEPDEATIEAEPDEATIEAAFEQCDPILDGLSEDAQDFFGNCPEDDEHDDAAEELEGSDA